MSEVPELELAPERLREGLERAFAAAPAFAPGHDYELAGRRLLARRRRSLLAAACAALAIAMPATVLGVASVRDGDDRAPVAGRPRVPDGWRTESWNGVTFAVPSSWERGDPSQWCIGGDTSPPLVLLPGQRSTVVECVKAKYWYGAILAPTDVHSPSSPDEPTRYHAPEDGTLPTYPADSWVVQVDTGGAVLTVIAPTKETAERIAASVHGP